MSYYNSTNPHPLFTPEIWEASCDTGANYPQWIYQQIALASGVPISDLERELTPAEYKRYFGTTDSDQIIEHLRKFNVTFPHRPIQILRKASTGRVVVGLNQLPDNTVL